MFYLLLIFGSVSLVRNVWTVSHGSNADLADDILIPNDVVTVSKFIKQFHRSLENGLYPIQENESSNDNDLSPLIDETDPHIANRSLGADKNHTSIVNCSNARLSGGQSVELVKSSRLVKLLIPNPNITSRHMEAQCVVLLFYSRTCPFSCLAAPHFNALPRAFPAIKMAAVNAMKYQSFNTQYGIAGVPTIILFHNGRAVAKFNDSEYTLKEFARFIMRFTGIKPAEKMFVRSEDFGGPVPSKLVKETDYVLGLAWLIVLAALAVGVSKSSGWRTLVEDVQNTWREAQAHHEHAE
ncbi:thioredoxin domain containing 15 [Nesidiocoris tenuis]|uniref:Thioredoxin domain containing 15 n=1 Tax=Nesidiocoris tenuis TaxID=355587 RepID=A0ABN7A6S7_9HEMI|nr:thioredoxin domain containing 15 [Nesidiocoris tenuis]